MRAADAASCGRNRVAIPMKPPTHHPGSVLDACCLSRPRGTKTKPIEPPQSSAAFAPKRRSLYVSRKITPRQRRRKALRILGKLLMPTLRGSITALVTPFKDGALDEDAF